MDRAMNLPRELDIGFPSILKAVRMRASHSGNAHHFLKKHSPGETKYRCGVGGRMADEKISGRRIATVAESGAGGRTKLNDSKNV
jgi:hypothetical protein